MSVSAPNSLPRRRTHNEEYELKQSELPSSGDLLQTPVRYIHNKSGGNNNNLPIITDGSDVIPAKVYTTANISALASLLSLVCYYFYLALCDIIQIIFCIVL